MAEPTYGVTAHTIFIRVKIVLDTKLVFAFFFQSIFLRSSLTLFCLFPGCCSDCNVALPSGNYTPTHYPSCRQKGMLSLYLISGDIDFLIERQTLYWFVFVLQEMITQKFEPAVKNSEKNSGIEITNDSLENDTSTPRANSERSAVIPEVKVETVDTPASSPRVTKRAAKPLRPGKKQTENNAVLLTFFWSQG